MTTPARRSIAWERLWIQRARNRSPAALACHLSDGRWRRARHLDYLDAILRDAIVKGGARIIIEWPPRHGKSHYLSKWTPAWFLNAWPSKNVILASNTADLARKWGREVRNIIEANPTRLEVRLAADSTAAADWNTSAGGGMLTKGVEGTILGFGADLMVIDDPHRGQREASSQTQRQAIWDWWVGEARHRLEPNASVVVLHQRLHEADFIGSLLAQDENPWQVITLRGLAEEDDPLGREVGEALWPDRFPVEALAELSRDIGSHAFEAQYQQRPMPAGGMVFRREHFRYFSERVSENHSAYVVGDRTIMADSCWFAQTADTASTTKTTSDWTVVETFAVTPENDLLLLDVARVKLEVPDQFAFLMAQRARWPNLRWQAVECKDSGIGLIQLARRQGTPFRELKPGTTDKVTRAWPLATMYENAKVYHRADAPWLACFEAELLSFPNGAHDDQVDPAAYMGLELAKARPRGPVWL